MVNYIIKGNNVLTKYGIKNPLKAGMVKNMKAKIGATIKIADGKHSGVISAINYKEEPYKYVDVVIKEDEQKIDLKCGFPFSVTENTALGQLLQRFDAVLQVDKDIEIEDFIKVGAAVAFQTKTETTKKGTFARILSESIEPK